MVPLFAFVPVNVYAYKSIDQKFDPGGYVCTARVAGGP